jgi:hypothetical protein
MASHKFAPGNLVQFQRGFLEPRTVSGVYTVVRALPAGADGLQYQVQSDREPYGRIAPEHQLLPAAPPSDPRAAQNALSLELRERHSD